MTDSEISTKYQTWLNPPFDAQTRDQVKKLRRNPIQLKEAFAKNLEFGTGGIRGIMGVGTNRINRYTLGRCTQGLCNHLKTIHQNESILSVVAYDCRNHSAQLAKEVANVFAANGVKCFLFSELRTTPELSFAVRYLKAHCGIVITASHNPPQYNGYKVYGPDGGQIVPPIDQYIIDAIDQVSFSEIQFEAKQQLIELIDEKIDKAYFNTVLNVAQINPSKNKSLKIVFTSLHGTGMTAIPPVLEKAGFGHLHIVKKQAPPNGDFPTVESPNPEESKAFSMAFDLAKQQDAEIVIGTDPDADRLGVGVKTISGSYQLLSGNQAMVLMTEFLLNHKKRKGELNQNSFIATTIVSTPLMEKMAHHYGIECKICLTGFKWIGQMIEDFQDQEFICGGEESFGYLVGDQVRDKDAVSATLLMCEIAQLLKDKGSHLLEYLSEIYHKYGLFHEDLVSLTKEGLSGFEEIQQQLKTLRQSPPKTLANQKVVTINDFQSSQSIDVESQQIQSIELPPSNVLQFITQDHSKVTIRPSGTEPKIKFYFSLQRFYQSQVSLLDQLNQLSEEIGLLKRDFNLSP
ncbi:MAG: phospho-sugar mutase [Flavobacteriaceae bacterium]|nr:phospho-sugar mutase [Flavobacteriaceae bacterium]